MSFYSVQSFDSTIRKKIVFYQNTNIWDLKLLVLPFLMIALQIENGGQLFRRYLFIQCHSSWNCCFIKNPISLHERAIILSTKQMKVKRQQVNVPLLDLWKEDALIMKQPCNLTGCGHKGCCCSCRICTISTGGENHQLIGQKRGSMNLPSQVTRDSLQTSNWWLRVTKVLLQPLLLSSFTGFRLGWQITD